MDIQATSTGPAASSAPLAPGNTAAVDPSSPPCGQGSAAPPAKHRSHVLSFLKHLGQLGLEGYTKVLPFVAKAAEDVEPEFDLLFPLEGPIYNSVVRAICIVEMSGSKSTGGDVKLQSVASLVSPHLKALAAHYGLSDLESDAAITKYINGLVSILSGPARALVADVTPSQSASTSPGSGSSVSLAQAAPQPQIVSQTEKPEDIKALEAIEAVSATAVADVAAVSSSFRQPNLVEAGSASVATGAADVQAAAQAQPGASASSEQQPSSGPVIDLSHYNGDVDLSQAIASGVAAVIQKATQGSLYRDPSYLGNSAKAQQAGLLWGAYHFGIGEDGETQAKHFLSTVNPTPDTLLVLDFEANRLGPSMTLEQAQAFVQYVQQKTGRWPGLYGGYYLKQLIGTRPDPVLSNCWLWLAQYDDKPSLPRGWPSWSLWQYTDGTLGAPTPPVPGVGICDRSFFNGTTEDLCARWKRGSLA